MGLRRVTEDAGRDARTTDVVGSVIVVPEGFATPLRRKEGGCDEGCQAAEAASS